MIDPRKPDFANTPVSPSRPRFAYAPRPAGAPQAPPADTFARNGHGRRHAEQHRRSDRSVAVLEARRLQERGAPAPAIPPQMTITTAFYNAGEVFRDTARCVFSQSLQAWEWIIVNDGSTNPESLALLDEFRRIDPRVRVVDHPENRGLSAARNTGFRAARTPYVYQLDSDDLIEPTALEKCLWYIHTHPEAAFVTTHVVGFGAQEYLWQKGFELGREFLRENLTTPMGIIRRHVFDEVGGYDESNRGGMEDWEFWLRCAAGGRWGATLPELLAWYRRRDQHWDAWENMRADTRRQEFKQKMLHRYERAFEHDFPYLRPRRVVPFEDIRVDPGLSNPLAKEARRLLLVAPWLTLGGADKFNVAMVRELVARGWEVTIATTLQGDNSWLPEFTRLTPDVFVTPNFLHPTDVPAFLRYLIESRSPDVVMVSNSELGYHVLPYLRSFCPEPAYVDLSHMEEPWWKNGGHPRYGAAAQATLDLNIVVSEHLKRWQVRRGADPERIEVCYVSACEDSEHWRRDEEEREKVRTELDIPPEQPVILYAGRIVEQKRPRTFAKVMRALAAAGMDFTCLVAGDGPDMEWLRRYVSDNRLGSRVRLLGAVPHAGMHELMSASDVFFLPSMWEGIAISIYEAMSMELAVVGADVGGQRELVTPECGVLIPRRDHEEEEIAEYASALITILGDPERRARLGRAARRRILERFEPAHMGDRIVEILARAERLRDDAPRPSTDRSFAIECACRGVEYLRACAANEHLSHERERLLCELDALRRERDALIQHRDQLARDLHELNSFGCIRGVCSPGVEAAARRMIRENMRYVAVDRINSVLKSIKVQPALKALTVRLVGRGRR